MLQISEIRNRESLEAWLKALPLDSAAEQAEARRVAVSIAARSAARVLPLHWRWSLTEEALKGDVAALPVLRCCLISLVAAKVPTENIRRAAATAAHAASAADLADAIPAAAHAAYVATAAATAATAADAATTAHAASAGTAAATAFAYAAHSGAFIFWIAVRSDCDRLVAGQDVFALPLWPDDSPRPEDWPKLRRALLQDGATPEPGDDWRFWIAWYDRMLDPDGHSPDWDLLEEIALIAPDIWDAGPKEALPAINAIWARYRDRDTPKFDLLNAALFDFRFDQIAYVMRAVPMPQDWQRLKDPELLRAFLSDAEDLREGLALLANALAAEGQAMQGAGAVRTYLKAVLDELDKAETSEELRVGKLLEYGHILESSQTDEVLREFGPLAEPFRLNVRKLRDLIRRHFSATLARLSVLRDIRMEEDAPPWEVLCVFRGLIESVKTGADGVLPPAYSDDAAVLDDILDSVERLIRQLDASQCEDVKSSLRRELDFQLAKVGATAEIYRERAFRTIGHAGDISDTTLTWTKRVQGLWSLAKTLQKAFRNFSD